ncbi:MAG: VWA domain-containing protein [Chloroflexi bacterium]|nr:VWA domain-containing protein [Chloroflexota bacterium]
MRGHNLSGLFNIQMHLILNSLIIIVMIAAVMVTGCGGDEDSTYEPTASEPSGTYEPEFNTPVDDDADDMVMSSPVSEPIPEPLPEVGAHTFSLGEPTATSEPDAEPAMESTAPPPPPPPVVDEVTIDSRIIFKDYDGLPAEASESTTVDVDGGASASVRIGTEEGELSVSDEEPIVIDPSIISSDKSESLESTTSGFSMQPEPQSGTLTAGDIDDNLNFAYYLRYYHRMLRQDKQEVLPSEYIEDRVTMRVIDGNGQPISNAIINIYPHNSSTPLIETYAGTNGIFQFFPTVDGAGNQDKFIVEVSPPNADVPYTYREIDLGEIVSDQTIYITTEDARSELPDSLDLMVVFDTTGSMKDELKYLTVEFKSIVENVREQNPNTDIRFGLIAYRDIGDKYVVRNFDFMHSVDIMQEQLAAQKADGGGDYPEAMDQALEAAVNAQWREGNTARVILLVADAPPHDENLWVTLDQAKMARQKGIRIYPVAASGVADTAEFLMRLSACVTQGRYLFLTDDSGVGNSHAEPKIPCYVVTRLDDLIVRVINSEISGVRIEANQEQIIRTVGNCDNGVCILN